MAEYTINGEADRDAEERHVLCPWTLRRDTITVAHFTTEDRAEEYRDYLIDKAKETENEV